jgi:hypothetical protein
VVITSSKNAAYYAVLIFWANIRSDVSKDVSSVSLLRLIYVRYIYCRPFELIAI